MVLMQPMADVFKLLTKEDLLPPYVNRFFYLLAPFIAVSWRLISISIIPFGPEINVFGVRTYMQITDVNVGILFVLAISSVSVYGVALAGWSSNNKYSLLGGLRSSAQMISYELTADAGHRLSAASCESSEFPRHRRQPGWILSRLYSALEHLSDAVSADLCISVLYDRGFCGNEPRVPFDLPEAENELVAGFHTEYSSMKFACFFMSEYANMVTITCVATLLFLGGWHPLFPAPVLELRADLVFVAAAAFFLPRIAACAQNRSAQLSLFGLAALVIAFVFAVPVLQPVLVPAFWFLSKVGFLLFLYIWVRGTLPRFRYDQLMHFAWTFLFPCALINLLVTAFCVAVF
jgi:NADH-quinone oxidoreductase subunit H